MPPLYGFLGRGAVAFLSGFAWPEPGTWVRAGVDAPREAVRGIRADELPWWLDDELWEVELAGELVVDGHAVHGERGRLVRRVPGWTDAAADELVTACEWRLREARLDDYAADVLLYARDAATSAAGASVAAYIAAHALAGGDKSSAAYEDGFERERRWQVEWLKRRLQL